MNEFFLWGLEIGPDCQVFVKNWLATFGVESKHLNIYTDSFFMGHFVPLLFQEMAIFF